MTRALLCLAAAWMAVIGAFWLGGPSDAIAATWSGVVYSVALTGPVIGLLSLVLFFPGIVATIAGNMPPLIISLPLAVAISALVYAALVRSAPGEILTLTWRGSSYSGSLAWGVASMVAFSYLIAFLVTLGRGDFRLSFTTGRMRGHAR